MPNLFAAGSASIWAESFGCAPGAGADAAGGSFDGADGGDFAGRLFDGEACSPGHGDRARFSPRGDSASPKMGASASTPRFQNKTQRINAVCPDSCL